MNEIIRQLIEKATVIRDVYHPGDDGHPTPTVYFDKEKFAELIVRECAGICRNVSEAIWTEQHQSNIGTALTCEAAIKKHFGVEE